MPEQEKYPLEAAAEEAAKIQKKIKHYEAETYQEAEQQLELQASLESKEVEKFPPLLLFYRENDLFRDYLPDIVNELRSLGRKVEIQSFPAGTKPIDMGRWTFQNKEKFRGKEVVTDGTLALEVEKFRNIAAIRKNWKRNIRGELDRLFNETAAKIVSKEMFGKEEPPTRIEDIEKVDALFAALVKNILANESHRPDKIFIILQEIAAHEPFWELLKNERERLGLDWKDPGVYQEGSPELKKNIFSRIKKWFIDAGIKDEDIISMPDKSKYYEADHAKNWLIADRHARIDPRSLEKAILLMLPFQNFFADAEKYGLITVTNPQGFKKELIEVFKKEFIPKPDEESKPSNG